MKYVVFLTRVCILCFIAFACIAANVNNDDLVTAKQKEVKAFVQNAVEYVEKYGEKAALQAFDDPHGKFVKGNLYIFASYYMDYGQGLVIASGTKSYVGKDFYRERDLSGVPLLQAMSAQVQKGGGWVVYKWINPTTKKMDIKHSYVMPVPHYMFLVGAGYYDSDVAKPSK